MSRLKEPYFYDEVSFWQGSDGYYMQVSDCKQTKLTKKQVRELGLKIKLGESNEHSIKY